MVARKTEAGKVNRKRRNSEGFSVYIYKVLKETLHSKDSKGINKKAMSILNSMVVDVLDKLAAQSTQLIRYTNKHTLSYKEIEASVKLLFPSDLAQHAIQDGRKAIGKFLGTA